MRRRIFLAALAGGILVSGAIAPTVWAQGCALCKDAAGAGGDGVASGFNWSIFVLIGATYTVILSIGGWLVLKHVRAGARRQSAKVVPLVLTNTGKESVP